MNQSHDWHGNDLSWALLSLMMESTLLSRVSLAAAPVNQKLVERWRTGETVRPSPMWISRWNHNRVEKAWLLDWDGATAVEKDVDIKGLINLLEEVSHLRAFQLAVHVAWFGDLASDVLQGHRSSILRPNEIAEWFDARDRWTLPSEELLVAVATRMASTFLTAATDTDALATRIMMVVDAAIAEPWQVRMPSFPAVRAAMSTTESYLDLERFDIRPRHQPGAL